VPRSAAHKPTASFPPPVRRRIRMLSLVAAAATVLGGVFALAPAADAATAATITYSPDVISGGQSATGTLTLTGTATTATTLTLENFAPGLTSVPATVTVPAGASSTTFTLNAAPLTSGAGDMCVEAEPGDAVGCLWVNVVGGATLNEVTFAGSPVAGAGTDAGSVSFTDPTPGTTVTLSSSNSAALSVPATVSVPDNARGANFTGTTGTVTTATNVTITAVNGTSTQTITVIVTPRPGATGSDTVTIKTSKWDKGVENIEASSTNHSAVLFIGDTPGEQQTLTNEGGGTYKLQFDEVNQPTSVSIFSSFGGTATATITQ
jgi:hypothetical protein